MTLKYLYFFGIILFCKCEVCIRVLTYKATTDVMVNCGDKDFTVNTTVHKVNWGDFKNLFPNKYPYIYQKNGSLLVKDVSDDDSHFICEVKDILTDKSLFKCGTTVVILKPLVLKFIPVNETVKNGSEYKINCHGGGGDYTNWKLSYFVNDVEVFYNKLKIFIHSDTKIECRLVSRKDNISAIAYITVEKDGVLTDEEKLQHNKCAVLSEGVCYKKFPVVSHQIYSSYESGRLITEQILTGLFQILDNQIIAEPNEDQCVDRFQRLICSMLYTPCLSELDNKMVKKATCRESCDVTLETICRNTIHKIKQLSSKFIAEYSDFNKRSNDFAIPEYKQRFVDLKLAMALSVFNCSSLESFRNRMRPDSCTLLNLDIIPGPNYVGEKKSSLCYNSIGRNYTGRISEMTGNTKCIEWRRVPQLYTAFYQQNLQNHSFYCRNPGAILKMPMCLVTIAKTEGELSLRDVNMIPCMNIYTCDYYDIIKKSEIAKGSMGVFIIVGVTLLVMVLIGVIISIRCVGKKFSRNKSKLIHADEMSLNDTQIQLFDNKTYMYKNVQNGHYSCPIYNSACLERVFKISDGAYGEILLVQAVFEDSTQLVVDESSFLTNEKTNFNIKSSYESDDNSIDDFILSKDKTFNGKPCWPFDKSSESGCCPFAVIKYSIRSSEPTMESRFAQETKILSLLNHPNIMRFYGVTVNNTGKIISRIIEYLPNGTMFSILIGDRPRPLTMENHDRNKVENGYQTMNALQKHRIKENNISVSTTESRQLKRKKTLSSQGKEPELPIPTEKIELNNKQLVKWIIEICDAVMYLHGKHFLHRDIATRNCLVGSHLETKLSDFNFVQKFTIGHDLIGSKHEYIPIRWLPKETLENLMFNIDTDVWMFGVFMWEVMSLGKQPYGDLDLNETCESIISGVLLGNPDNCPDDIYGQMKLCWSEANSRPCLETIKRNLINILEIL